MEIAIGTTRRVFIFKNIVIKVARIYWKKASIELKYFFIREYLKMKKYRSRYFIQKKILRRNSEKNRIKEEEKLHMKLLPRMFYEAHGFSTVGYLLFSGIIANVNERRTYRRTKSPFVIPTYFSFLGLFNIQKRGKKIDFWDNREVWGYIWRNSQNPDQPHCDGHTLADTENYCIDDGKLKLVDYGNRQIAEFLRINGENLYKNFKLPE